MSLGSGAHNGNLGVDIYDWERRAGGTCWIRSRACKAVYGKILQLKIIMQL